MCASTVMFGSLPREVNAAMKSCLNGIICYWKTVLFSSVEVWVMKYMLKPWSSPLMNADSWDEMVRLEAVMSGSVCCDCTLIKLKPSFPEHTRKGNVYSLNPGSKANQLVVPESLLDIFCITFQSCSSRSSPGACSATSIFFGTYSKTESIY